MLNRLIAWRARAVALAIAVATWSVAPGLVQGAPVPTARATNHGAGAVVAAPAADLTERDVAASN